MQTAGIIIEYNPMHGGHVHLMEQVRARLGEETAIVCAMSGNFVQRGDFALVGKSARAEAAIRGGADLVLELPLSWAAAPAERFADGGVQVLSATGVVEYLAFGSESGDAAALMQVAEALECRDFPTLLKAELQRGDSFAAARARAVGRLLGQETAQLLSQPNNTLGVEYCKSCLRQQAALKVLSIPRLGAGHDALPDQGEYPSGSAIRTWLESGERDRALEAMALAMKEVYLREESAGRAPVFVSRAERAILARLRSMEEADFAVLDEGREGLCNRLYQVSRTACTLEGFLAEAKTRRYAYARLRRLLLWAYLGLTPGELPRKVPYLRVLAANRTGRELLGRMRDTAVLPILTKPADVRALSEEAQRVFRQEVRATDLYTLAYPSLAAAKGGQEWRTGPVIV